MSGDFNLTEVLCSSQQKSSLTLLEKGTIKFSFITVLRVLTSRGSYFRKQWMDCQCSGKIPITHSLPRKVAVFKLAIYLIFEVGSLSVALAGLKPALLNFGCDHWVPEYSGRNRNKKTNPISISVLKAMLSLMSLTKLAPHSSVGECGLLMCFFAFSDLHLTKSNFPWAVAVSRGKI